MQPMNPPNVRWGEWLGEGWQMFAEKWQVWVVQILVVFLIFAVPAVPFYVMMMATQLAAAQSGAPPEPSPLMLPFVFLIALGAVFGGAYLWSGLYRTAFKQLRGEPISVKDLFSGGDAFLRVLGAFLAMGVLTMLGGLLCILPGLVVPGLLMFTVPLIVDRNLSVGEALSASYNATKSNWLMFALFAIVVGILASLGQLACYVGLLATYPLQFTIAAIAYRDVFGVAGARSFAQHQPPPPASSYAPSDWNTPIQMPPPPPRPQFSAPPPQPPQEPTVSICPHCGATLNRTANFCNQCGLPLRQG
ncbi:MAG: zinc-ribbon domain-containing protein [Acidobacteria bacterium]|nr:zinc-ribbon domain-containing protein [Acidobacteriota bacterium]